MALIGANILAATWVVCLDRTVAGTSSCNCMGVLLSVKKSPLKTVLEISSSGFILESNAPAIHIMLSKSPTIVSKGTVKGLILLVIFVIRLS